MGGLRVVDEPLYVTQADYDREKAQLERWLAEYDRKWAEQYRITARIRYWQSRVTSLERSFKRYRKIGWVYLKKPQRTRYIKLRDLLVPHAHQKLAGWHNARGRLAGELLKELYEIRELQDTIARKQIIPAKQLVHVKIIIYSVVAARPPKKYTKRFQAFYNVDALRDQDTGDIDYTAKLTQKELDICLDDFYVRWGWHYPPPEATTPKWIESGEWETLEEPKGADVKQLSIRENEEEVYDFRFRPPEILYEPSKKESEDMKKLLEG